MTPAERKAQQQQEKLVIGTGYKAYRALFPQNGNPYTKEPLHNLWDKGWRSGAREEQAKRFPPKQAQPGEASNSARRKQGARGPQTTQKPNPDTRHQPVGQKKAAAPAKPKPQSQPVNTDKLIQRFNRRPTQ